MYQMDDLVKAAEASRAMHPAPQKTGLFVRVGAWLGALLHITTVERAK